MQRTCSVYLLPLVESSSLCISPPTAYVHSQMPRFIAACTPKPYPREICPVCAPRNRETSFGAFNTITGYGLPDNHTYCTRFDNVRRMIDQIFMPRISTTRDCSFSLAGVDLFRRRISVPRDRVFNSPLTLYYK